MSNGTVSLKLRPIKFAFVVDPNDKDAVLEAIRINTFLWGGIYNPILPYDNGVEDKDKILLGYLDAYDPDYVTTSIQIPTERVYSYGPEKIAGRRIIECAKILLGVGQQNTPMYGLGLFDILDYFLEKELKFQRRKPLQADSFLPELGDDPSIFLASVFGNLNPEVESRFKDSFEEEIGTKRLPCTLENYADFLSQDVSSLIEISSIFHLETMPSSTYLNQPVNMDWWGLGAGIFFLDAESILDVIDFWNLRAIGWDLIAIPKQISSSEKLRQQVSDFVEKSFGIYQFNDSIYRYTTLFKGRSISLEEFETYANSIQVSQPENPAHSKLVMKPSFPRIWDADARYKDGVECWEVESKTTYQDVLGNDNRIEFKSVGPKFYKPSRFHFTESNFANEIELGFFREKDLIAEVIPAGGEHLERIISGVGGDWRLSKKSIVVMSKSPSERVSMEVPRAEKVLTGWLKSHQWNLKLSDKGHIAKQILKQVGGIDVLSPLANEDLILLLEKMNSLNKSLREISTKAGRLHKIFIDNDSLDVAEEIENFLDQIRSVKLPDNVEGKSMHHDAFWAEIQKIAAKRGDDPKEFLKHLMELQVFRLGVRIRCSVCTQHSWYSNDEFGYELQCPKCTERFSIRSYSPIEIDWSYRTFGPFSLPNHAYGAYSVLLTFRFFSGLLQAATTPIMSFEAKKESTKIEADLGLFVKGEHFRKGFVKLIFAECKTYNSFIKKDADRMITLAEHFPDAILCFATLKQSLDEREKELIQEVVNRSQSYEENRRPFKPILILTNTELFSKYAPKMTWRHRGGRYAEVANSYIGIRGLPELCEATQQLYLT
jgi:hypothetical protein